MGNQGMTMKAHSSRSSSNQ